MMKKTFLLVAMCAAVCMASAQDKMRVWIGTKIVEYPISMVDSVTFLLSETPVDPDIPDPDPTPDPSTKGGIGVFTVAAGKTVTFAQGNLQYNAAQGSHLRADGTKAKGTWRFAENQYDYIGATNSNISETYDGWIDLFGWGTSGYDNTENDPAAQYLQPWHSSDSHLKQDSTLNCDQYDITGECEWEYTYYDYNYYGYGPSTNMQDKNLTGTSAYYDWGVYNAISNGGNEAGVWRTLSSSEWYYLFNTRTNAQYLWSQGSVNGVYGVIILPDDFKKPADITWSYQANNWTTNSYDLAQWAELEALGAVFLPAAGYRYGESVYDVQDIGYYWSSSYSSGNYAYSVYFASSSLSPQLDYGRCRGFSVRLAQDL